jgi:hypothetical protein
VIGRILKFAAIPLVFLVAVVAAIVLVPRFGLFQSPPELTPPEARVRLLRLEGIAGWVNGAPLTPDSLAGRPVVLLFWSDTDPASLRMLSEAQVWHQAYARFGVRVVGVHTPDYSFAADSSVPARAAQRLGADFPIALDPAHRIRALLPHPVNESRIVVADSSGTVLFSAKDDRLGEVDRILRAEVQRLQPQRSFPPQPELLGSPHSEPREATRFVFLGASQVHGGPMKGVVAGRSQTFTTQFRFQEEGAPYVPYPVGRWTPGAEGIAAARGGPANFIVIRYAGGQVGAIMGPPPAGSSRVWILADDAWLEPQDSGQDVRHDSRGASYVEVTEPRLYSIMRGAGGHVLKFSPEQSGLTMYGFTFEPFRDGRDG